MDNKQENKTRFEEFIATFSKEEIKTLDKAVEALTKVFSEVIPIGDETVSRFISSTIAGNEKDKKYYNKVLELCNKCLAVVFLIEGVSIDE